MPVFVGRSHRWISRALAITATAGPCLAAGQAQAHVELLTPSARYTPDHQKDDPCGHVTNPPGEARPTVLTAGETITVRFEEFVQHTGHFRIALDPTGTDAFVSPTGFDDLYNSPEVLLDDIPDDQDGGLHTVEVTLPDEPCDPCTLQLIQVMTDDGAWGPGNDDLYFQCADIVIEVAAAEGGESTSSSATTASDETSGGDGMPATSGVNTTAPFTTGDDGPGGGGDSSSGSSSAGQDEDGGCGCHSDGGAPGSLAWLLLTGGLAFRRRR